MRGVSAGFVVNVCPASHLPCVTRFASVAVHVDSPYIECLECSFPEDSVLCVFSIVFVCGCNLTLCPGEVIFLLIH